MTKTRLPLSQRLSLVRQVVKARCPMLPAALAIGGALLCTGWLERELRGAAEEIDTLQACVTGREARLEELSAGVAEAYGQREHLVAELGRLAHARAQLTTEIASLQVARSRAAHPAGKGRLWAIPGTAADLEATEDGPMVPEPA
jgi:hypothetical protein